MWQNNAKITHFLSYQESTFCTLHFVLYEGIGMPPPPLAAQHFLPLQWGWNGFSYLLLFLLAMVVLRLVVVVWWLQRWSNFLVYICAFISCSFQRIAHWSHYGCPLSRTIVTKIALMSLEWFSAQARKCSAGRILVIKSSWKSMTLGTKGFLQHVWH